MAQLSEISREVQLRAPESEFPLGLGSLYSEMLTRIAHVDLVWHRGRIIILIHIPLLERTEYNLYRMHPWPVPQEGKYTGSAHIMPTMPYVAVSTDRRVYFLLDAQYFASYRTANCKYMCATEVPRLEVSTAKACEIQMLMRPSARVYHSCDVRIREEHTTFWKRLSSQGGWLCSLRI